MYLYLLLLISLFSFTSCQEQQTIVLPKFKTLEFRKQKFDVIRVNLKETPVFLAYQNDEKKAFRSFQKIESHLKAKGKTLSFAMNGGMYLKDGSPQGLYIENGQIIKAVDTVQSAYGNFYLQPNGIFYLKGKTAKVITTEQYLESNLSPDFATQSGPMLIIDDEVHPVFREGSENVHIRNGVGMISDHQIVFAISHTNVNLYDFALLFKEKLNCSNALYLDGFVSRAYMPELGRKSLEGNFGVMIYTVGSPKIED